MFKFDPQHRRHVEGWNIVYYDAEDGIGLTADEYIEVGFDFQINDMYEQAIRAYQRAIDLGSKKAMTSLGLLYEILERYEEAYRCFLEAALYDEYGAVRHLARFYKDGIYVDENEKKSQQLKDYAKDIRTINH